MSEVAGLDALDQLRVGAEPDIAGVAGVVVVEQVLAAEAAGRRQIVGLEEAGEVGDARGVPAAAAQDDERPLGLRQQPPQLGHRLGRGCASTAAAGRPSATPARVDQHVLGQRQHHRPRPARRWRWRRRGGRTRGCARRRRSRPPTWPCRRTSGGSRPPGTRRAPRLRASIWPTNRTIGVLSCWAMCTPALALVAPGPAGRPRRRRAGRSACPRPSAIMAAPPSWRQTTKRISGVSCSASSDLEVALARARRTRCRRPWNAQLVDQDPPARPLVAAHRSLPPGPAAPA